MPIGEETQIGSHGVCHAADMIYVAWLISNPNISAEGESVDEAINNCIAAEKQSHAAAE